MEKNLIINIFKFEEKINELQKKFDHLHDDFVKLQTKIDQSLNIDNIIIKPYMFYVQGEANPYICKYCGDSYRTFEKIIRHLTLIHGINFRSSL